MFMILATDWLDSCLLCCGTSRHVRACIQLRFLLTVRLTRCCLQIDGIWHTSIVVGGLEYYYGGGVNQARPGSTPFGQPLQVIDLGYEHTYSPQACVCSWLLTWPCSSSQHALGCTQGYANPKGYQRRVLAGHAKDLHPTSILPLPQQLQQLHQRLFHLLDGVRHSCKQLHLLGLCTCMV